MSIIRDYKQQHVKYITDDEMLKLLDQLTYLRDRAILVYYESETIIAADKYKELHAYYISVVGHKQASVILAGKCDTNKSPLIMKPYELIFHMSDISHMKENNLWMVSSLIHTDQLPTKMIACEIIDFD